MYHQHCFGPLFVYTEKSYESYHYYFSTLLKLHRSATGKNYFSGYRCGIGNYQSTKTLTILGKTVI